MSSSEPDRRVVSLRIGLPKMRARQSCYSGPADRTAIHTFRSRSGWASFNSIRCSTGATRPSRNPISTTVGSHCCEAKSSAAHRRSMSWAIPAATAPISTDGRAKVRRDGPSRMRCPISGEAKPGRMARTPGAADPVLWAHNGPGFAIHSSMPGARPGGAPGGPPPRMSTESKQYGSGAPSSQFGTGGERRRQPLIRNPS
jgi:hypothetical protein